ncbi:aldehyde dehydrogenase family protein [Mesorhizobium sp. M0006]|uniref:aldehyde dehydrogenase family protein n=1 Tax=Mesorhizobium sp. M0006 TaxID=2956838 RepID=UPI00333D7BE6
MATLWGPRSPHIQIIDMVALTGSGRSGQHVASSASASFKRVHLELGEKAPGRCVRRRRLASRSDHNQDHGFVEFRPGMWPALPDHRL